MPKVLIVVDEESDLLGEALKQAILMPSVTPHNQGLIDVEIKISASLRQSLSDDILVCPLTLNLPESLEFPQRGIYQDCRDVMGLRQRVERKLHVLIGAGKFWLPIVLTAKGALYAEAITAIEPLRYLQPLHLPDRYRQPLYELGQRLLKLISASPSTYLMQFGFDGETVVFDRLFPFPAAPAIATLNTQSPNLFVCHWHCLRNTPILDLTIAQTSEHQIFQPSQATFSTGVADSESVIVNRAS